MAYDRRSFAGGAAATTLAAGINASTLTVTIAASTGWPTGGDGDFFAVIDRGTASEEKVRVDTRSGTTLTIITGGRGVDGTTGASHDLGATIELCLAAVDLDEANAHLSDTGLDHHTQYLNTARHDIEGRHAFGAALGTPAAPADIGTAAATGTGDNPAREDHVHQLGTGSIDTAAQFAAGVIDAAAIGSNAVTTAKILDANVTAAKFAATIKPIEVVANAAAAGAAATDGRTVWLQDTDKLVVDNGTAWVYPYPLGVLATDTRTTIFSGFSATTPTIITGLAVTFTPLANRYVRIRVDGVQVKSDAAMNIFLHVMEDSAPDVDLGRIARFDAAGALDRSVLSGEVLLTPTAAAHTYAVALAVSTSTCDIEFDSVTATITAYDAGPV